MRLKLLMLLIAISLAACAPAQQDGTIVTLAPSVPALQGTVDIVFPMSGSVIYAESLYLQGTSENLPAEGFLIQVIAPDDSVIAQSTVQPANGQWTVELVHNYSGDPTEATIIAKGFDATSTEDYDLSTILLSGSASRPAGVFGTIIVPSEGETVGGDSILVTGRGSGFFENTFILSLEAADDGEVISQTIVTMNNPYFIDEMIWEAEIARNDFVGNAILRAYYQNAETGEEVEFSRVTVVVSSVAG